MGVNLVGQGATPVQSLPIYITNIAPVLTGSGDNLTEPTKTLTFVPKGAYAITMNQHGNTSYGSSASGGYVRFNTPAYSVYSYEADTGRPGPVYQTATDSTSYAVPQNVFVLTKDSYVYVLIHAPASPENLTRYDVVLQPTNSSYTAYPTITGNRTQTATAGVTSGSNSDINWGTVLMGWDYDNDNPFLITGSNVATAYTQWRRLATTFFIWRYSNSTGKWTKKQVDNVSTSTLTWYIGSGLYFHQDSYPQFFIKNNYIHNLTSMPIAYDASSNAWGWIKGNLSVGGTTLTMEPGHSNTAFCTAAANIQVQTQDSRMMYTWDRVSAKVIYTGAKSGTYNGTYGANNWRSYWSQWDIATDTVEYSNVNSQTADPRTAGSAGNSSLVYNIGVANAADGFIYGVGPNSTSDYLAKWSRTGTYTGIGNFSVYYPMQTNTTLSLGVNTQTQRILFLPNNIMVFGGMATTFEHNTGTNVPAALYDTSMPLNYTYAPIYGNWSLNQSSMHTMIVPQGVFVLHMSYTKAQGNTLRYTALITTLKAPLTSTVLTSIIPSFGGIPTANTPLSGINDGTW